MNVFSGRMETMEVNWNRQVLLLREKVTNQVMNWNLNCLLAKWTGGKWETNKVFLHIRWNEGAKRKETIYCQFHSKTRTEFHYEEIEEKEQVFQKLRYFETIYSIREFICFEETVVKWLESPKITFYRTQWKMMENKDAMTKLCMDVCEYLTDQ
jgi:hypothetical protein